MRFPELGKAASKVRTSMIYVVLASTLAVLLLQATGAIPLSSVGGPMMIALAVFCGALAIAVQEVLTRRRGVGGWILNIVVSFGAAFLAAPVAGFVMVLLLSPFASGSSLAASGGVVFSISLAGTMIITLLGSSAALSLMSRWRDAPVRAA